MTKCDFTEAWIGECGVENCEKHKDLACDCCENPATHSCDSTVGLFVCGETLCDECEHELDEKGTDTMRMSHVRKTHQKYKPWYMQPIP